VPRTALPDLLRPGDLLVANDAATLPASLRGIHRRTGGTVEVRLAGRSSLRYDDVRAFTAVVFGSGDHRTRTELRPLPPLMRTGDGLDLGPLRATVRRVLGHPRLLCLRFDGSPEEVWDGIARHGRPIQYAHVPSPLALWDVWTRIAAHPVAFEAPSAGFVLDWEVLGRLRACGIGFATLTHAAGLSSTGDPALDARLPLDEAYFIPETTACAIARARRVVAVGTSVTRALEHAAARSGLGLATLRIDRGTRLRVVHALLTGVHEPGESHYMLLRAFAEDRVLRGMTATLEREAFRSHEFGDAVLLYRS
jgi:S-adenosylmethionine:tRNA ribosyltransferase-isomerase